MPLASRRTDRLASQRYGATTSIGPRQSAIVADVTLAASCDLAFPVALLVQRHGESIAGPAGALLTLRKRKLIRYVNRSHVTVTDAGAALGNLALACRLSDGCGVVVQSKSLRR